MALHRTPSELLAACTSADITEMIAFERLEPFGPLHDELLAGRICATLVNLQQREGSDPVTPGDFFPALGSAVQGYADRLPRPPLTDEQRSALIDKAMFGRVLH